MKPIALTIAAVCYLAGAGVTFWVVHAIETGSPEISFVVGAVMGSQVGAVMHRRQPGARPTVRAKAVLGGVLAVCAVVLGVALHLAIDPFEFVELTVPLAAVGSFVFPFVLFDTMWKSLSKKDTESKPNDS